jgi:hypothetical protein
VLFGIDGEREGAPDIRKRDVRVVENDGADLDRLGGNGAMVEPLRHRQTKGAATDMFYLMPPRHISTLHLSAAPRQADDVR